MRGFGGRLALGACAMTMAAGVVGAGPAGASQVIYSPTGGAYPDRYHFLNVLPALPPTPLGILAEPVLASVRVEGSGKAATVRDDLLLLGISANPGCSHTIPLREMRCVAPLGTNQDIGVDLWGGALGDRLTASGPNFTSVQGGGGDDRIDVRGASLVYGPVQCGAGRDTVIASATTPVASDCEIVQRS